MAIVLVKQSPPQKPELVRTKHSENCRNRNEMIRDSNGRAGIRD
jgi:hypothetical protein